MEMRSFLNKEPTNNDYEEMGNFVNEEDAEYEEFDISDSEFKEYKEAVHKLLKFRNYNVRAPNGQYRCPFCTGEEKQGYHCLLEHAVRVAEGSTGSGKQRANHSAMAKYLVIDLANEEKTMPTRKVLEKKDETHCNAFKEAGYFLGIAKDQSKRVLEQLEMLDFESKDTWLNSLKEELDKRQANLTEEKRKDNLTEERLTNDKLLEVGKKLMKGLEDKRSHWQYDFGVKKRGEIDEKAFFNACKKWYLLNESETKAFELCCFWVKKWGDAKGNPQRLLQEKDELLRGLKENWGKKIYNAVVEFIEYNSKGDSMELWNIEEGMNASHCEVIRYIFRKWKELQCERDELAKTIHSMPLSQPMAMSTEEDESDEESWDSEGCPADKWNVKDIKAMKDLIKPQKPISAFFLFMEDFQKAYKKKNPNNNSVAAVGKAGGEKWRSMSEAEKAPYQAEAVKKKQEFENYVIGCCEKLISSGHQTERSAYDKLEDEDDDTDKLEDEDDDTDTYSSESFMNYR